MDYSLAALKLLCEQLKDSREIPSQNAMTLGGILFQRAWLQGILVPNDDHDNKLLLHDGTGIVELSLSAEFCQRQWKTGYICDGGRRVFRPYRFTRSLIFPRFQIEKQCGTLKFWRHTNCSTRTLSKTLYEVIQTVKRNDCKLF